MKNKKVFIISFLVNLIFSMITALLSLIVFNINNSSKDISVIMLFFICSLLITRIVLFNNFINSRLEIIIGSSLFVVGCLLMLINSASIFVMALGAISFGMAIGMMPPAILSILSDDGENKNLNLGIYNTTVAIASIFSPKFGEEMYSIYPQLLFGIWFVLAVCMFFLALFLKKTKQSQKNVSIGITLYNLKKISINSKFQLYFITLLFSSISYGSIVSFLPIYFTEIKLSIGIYYFFFWIGYIIVQFLKKIVYRFKIILLALVFILLNQLVLMLFSSTIVLYIFALIYGVGYGTLFKVFYVGIGNFSSLEERNMGFSIIGLISYIGVGTAPIFLIPFKISGWMLLFCGNMIYSLLGIIFFILLWRKQLDESL